MSLFRSLFKDPFLKEHYFEKEIEKEREAFEGYLFLLKEKVEIIALLRNKYFDIKHKARGYIQEDQTQYEAKGLLTNREKDRSLFYFKRWTNRKLKRLRKILLLDVKGKGGIKEQKKTASEIVAALQQHYQKKFAEGIRDVQKIAQDLERLLGVIHRQQEFIDDIYPLVHWTVEEHEKILPVGFLSLVSEELRLLFGRDVSSEPNTWESLVTQAIKKNNLPEEMVLRHLLEQEQEIIRKKRAQQGDEVVCYHVRPIYASRYKGHLFPLKDREIGLFIDTDVNEAKKIVFNFFNLHSNDELVIFKITLPEFFFKKCMRDPNGEEAFKGEASLKHSYVIKATQFSEANRLYASGKIRVEKHHS